MATKKKAPQRDATLDELLAAGVRYQPLPAESPAPAEAAPEQRGVMRAAADTALSFGRGAVQGVRMLSDVAGADNAVSGGLRKVEEYIGGLQSAQAQQDQQEVARILKEAEGQGILDQVVSGFKALAVAPVQTVANAAGTMVPTLAASMLMPGSGAAALALRTGAAGAMGTAQGVGTVKGAIYDEVQQRHLEAGLPAAEAAERAARAQEYSSANAPQMMLGGALGALAGSTGAERLVARMGAHAPGMSAGPIGRALTGAVAEGIPEAMQGGQEKFAANTALVNEGFAGVNPWQGVAANATLEGAAGAPMGAAFALPKPRGPIERALQDAGAADPMADAAARIAAMAPVEPGPAVQPQADVSRGAPAGGAPVAPVPAAGATDELAQPAPTTGLAPEPPVFQPASAPEDPQIATAAIAQREADKPAGPDELPADGEKVFKSMHAAMRAQVQAGEGAEIVPVVGGLVVRKPAGVPDGNQPVVPVDAALAVPAADGAGDQPDGSVGTVGRLADAGVPGEVLAEGAAPAGGDHAAELAGTGSQRPDQALTPELAPQTPELPGVEAAPPAAPDPDPLPDDTLAPSGKPWPERAMAVRTMKQKGDGFTIAKVAGGFVVRKRDAITPSQDTAGRRHEPDVHELAGDEVPLPESNEQGVQGVRREGREGLPAVAGELRGVPVGSGRAAVEESHAGPDREQQGVRAGQRAVGDAPPAGQEPDRQRLADVSERDAGPVGLGGKSGPASANPGGAAAGRLVDGGSVAPAGGHDSTQKGLRTAPVPDRQRGEVAGPVGRDDGHEPEHTAVAAAPRGDAAGRAETVADGWAAFPPETGTKGVPRAEMPQIKAEHRGAMVQFLKGRGILHEQEAEVDPGTLKATQAEFSPAKVEKARTFTEGDRAILVSSDNHILDGHHQALAAVADKKPIRVIRLDAPIDQLLPVVREFPSAEASQGASDVPKPDRVAGAAPGADPAAGGDRAGGETAGAVAQPAAAANHDRSEKPGPIVQQAPADPGATWDATLPKDRIPALLKAGWHDGSASTQAMMAKQWADLTPSQRARLSKAMEGGAAPAPPTAGPRVIVNRLGKDGLTDAERSAGKKPYNEPAPEQHQKPLQDKASGPIAPPASSTTPAPAKRSKAAQAAADARRAHLDAYFKPGNIVKSYGGHDEVLGIKHTDDGGFSVHVHAVTKSQGSGQWVRIGKPQDSRWHSTFPDARELKAGPVAQLLHQRGELVSYTEGRADGQPFKNAPDRGVAPVAAPAPSAAAPADPMTAAVATHKDPGEPAEAVTPEVVAEVITKAAASTDMTRSQMKAEALRLIDAAIEQAPSAAEVDDLINVNEPKTYNGKKEMTAFRAASADAKPGEGVVVKARETRDGEWDVTDDSYDGSGTGAKRKAKLGELAGTPAAAKAQLAKLMRRVQQDGTLAEPDFATINVPGDGVFKVLNFKEDLVAFRRKVEDSPGFKDRQPAGIESPRVNPQNSLANPGGTFGVESGSGGKLAAFSNMVDEGDMQAALDYAAASGIDPKTAKLTHVLRKRLDNWMRDEEMSARVAEREAEAPAPTAVNTEDASAAAETAAEPVPAAAPATITDVGEKIGGARKDMAVSGESRTKRATEDNRPAWARRFQVSQAVTGIDEQGEHTGPWVIRDLKNTDFMGQPKQVGRDTYATKEEADAAVPLAAVSMKHRAVPTRDGKYEIWRHVSDRKRVKVVDREFGSRDEALIYMLANAQAIVETNTTFGEADMPLPPDRARSGPARRTGNVKGEDFKDTFGFRGVEFGNWNNQDERQALMNDAYDGLMDLADVLGIPPKAIGLNGDLALAFGARGHGLQSARAHYELDRAVINLTKEKGAGSLAHEWFHALDHYFGRQDGKASAEWVAQKDGTRALKTGREATDDMVSGGFTRNKSGVRPEVREAYEKLLATMFKKAEIYVEDTAKVDKFTGSAKEDLASQLDDLRRKLSEQKDPRYWKRNNKPATAEQLAEFDSIAAKMVAGEFLETDWRTFLKGGPDKPAARASMSARWTNDTLERLSEIHKAVRGRAGFDADQKGRLDRLRGYMQRYSQRLKMLADAQQGTEKTKMVPTDFAMNAKELDQGRGGDYWTTPHEMAARAFQGYVEDKIAERGGASRFLNYGPENAGILTPWGFKRPFPTGAERQAINKAFDAFIGAIQVREDEAGNVAMLSRATPQTATVQRMDVALPDGKQWVTIYEGSHGERYSFHRTEDEARAAAASGQRTGGGTESEPVEPAGRGASPRAEPASGSRDGLGLTKVAQRVLDTRAKTAITTTRQVNRLVASGSLRQLPERKKWCFRYAAAAAQDGLGDMVIGVNQDAVGARDWHAVVMRDGYVYDPTMRQWFAPGVYESTGFTPSLSLTPAQVREFIDKTGGMAPDAMNQGLGESPPADTVFKRGTGGGIDLSSARKLAADLAAGGLVRLNVVASVADLPPMPKRWVKAKSQDGRVRGAYLPGTDQVWLFTDNLHDADEFVFTALHEAFHRGLARTIPEAKPLLRSMYRTNAALRAAADDQMRQHGLAKDEDAPDEAGDEAIEEALADMAGQGTARDLKGWQKLLDLIRGWLGKLASAAGVTINWTDDMVADFVAGIRREGLSGVHVSRAADVAPALSRGGQGGIITLKQIGPKWAVVRNEGTGNEQHLGYFDTEQEAVEYAERARTGGADSDPAPWWVAPSSGTLRSTGSGRFDSVDRQRAVQATLDARRAAVRTAADGNALQQDPARAGFCFPTAAQASASGVGDMVIGRASFVQGEWHAVVMRGGMVYDATLVRWFEPGVYESMGFTPVKTLTTQEVRDYISSTGNVPDARNQGLTDDGAKLSRAPADVGGLRGINQQKVRDSLADLLGGAGAKVSWWERTLGTQYAKAAKHPAFKAVFERVQTYIEDVSTFANEAANEAPAILPKLDTWRDLKNFGLSTNDAKAVAAPVFQGTLDFARRDGKLVKIDDLLDEAATMSVEEKGRRLMGDGHFTEGQLKAWRASPLNVHDAAINNRYEQEYLQAGVVFTDTELRADFNLTDAQIGQYRQFLATVNRSLDQVVAAEVLRFVGKDAPPALKQMATANRGELRAALEAHLGDSNNDLWNDIADRYNKVDRLKARGYAPLMRFGKYKVHITDAAGETLFFGLYETKALANGMARDFAADQQFKDARIRQGVLSQEAYKLLSDVPVESMEMFADAIGADKSEVFQQFLRLTKNNRSALKRLIHRKGTAGFSEDVPRVLASFVTSNARLASGTLNLPAAKQAAEGILDGDVQDEAVKLLEHIQRPTEAAAAVRGLMFMNFIGGSIASAFVNVTQPITMTLPYLTQFGGAKKATARLMAAGKLVATGGKGADAALAAALARAERDGIVSPQEIHSLQAQAMGAWGRNPWAKRAAFIWSAPFSLAEQFNRRVSFIAAYQTAVQEGIADPFAFAEKAVIETQGLYNPGNAPNLARGAVGAMALQFKQFSIHYLEWLGRMWNAGEPGSPERAAGRRAVLIALAMLMVVGGGEGLPFVDDIDDLVDTIGQSLGYDMNSKRFRRDLVAKELGLGDMAADVVARGLSSLPGMPMDVSVRMGMGNLLPATGLLLRSNTDRAGNVLEVAGPVGGLAKQYMTAAEKLLAGDAAAAAGAAMPIALQNAGKGVSMWMTGEARDSKNRKVMAVDEVDSLMKFLGFNPARMAHESRQIGMDRRSEQLAKNVEGQIVERWARAVADKNPDEIKAAIAERDAWNRTNPEQPIKITMPQVLQRARKMREGRAERYIKSVAPERRAAAAGAL